MTDRVATRSGPRRRRRWGGGSSKESRHSPAPEHHALERRGHQVDRHLGLVGQPVGQSPEHGTPADQVDALVDDVLGQLGRGLAQAVDAPWPR